MKNRRNKKLFYILGAEAFALILILSVWLLFSKEEDSNSNPSSGNYVSSEGSSVGLENGDIDVLSLEHEIAEETLSSTNLKDTDTVVEEGSTADEVSQNESEDTTSETDSKNTDTSADVTESSDDIPASEYVAALSTAQAGTILKTNGATDIVFYIQTDKRWASLYYGGTDTIEKYACGPTSMSIVISTLTDITIDPVQMSAWAEQNGYWYAESGSAHTLIPDAAKAFGLQSEGVENTPEAGEKIRKALKEGKLIVALMGEGQFTKSGHFIVLRGITEDGEIIVADPASEERTNKTWELSTIIDEARAWANAGGPFWIIWK